MDYRKEVKKIYKEYCEENDIKFIEKDFEDFLEFMEIDFYDWVRENLRCYFREN